MSDDGCWFCGKPGHTQAECYKKQNDEKRGKRQQNNYALTSENCDKEGAFVMQHETTMMAESSQKCNEDYMWYVDFWASNHMTGHENWFESLRELEIPGYVQIGGNNLIQSSMLEIFHYGKKKGKQSICWMLCMFLAKILIFVGQIVEQGM